MLKITNVKTEYIKNPLAIDVEQPVLSWNAETEEYGFKQTAYQVLAALDPEALARGEADMWDSGRVESDACANIVYRGKKLQSGRRYYWMVRVWGGSADAFACSEPAFWEMGLLNPQDWQGKWIGETEDHVNHIFRKSFSLQKEVKRARLYICGLGHYEMYLNGGRVGDRVLEPGWTNYHKTCLYSAYDVTGLLHTGENAVGVLLGDGMYNVAGGRYAYFPRSFGKMKLLMQMNIEYGDGTVTCVVSDESWRMAPSPVTFACIYGGEDYDARLWQAGFSKPGFKEDALWLPVVTVQAPKGALHVQMTPPLKVMQTLAPVSVKETKPGVYLYDLGQNFSGWAQITLRAQENPDGRQVKMTPGEILTKDGEPDQRVTGRGYAWLYTMNGEAEQTYCPHFTYTGFRYVQVEGAVPACFAKDTELNGRPIVEKLTGQFIYPEVELAGGFTCSSELFNQIHTIINNAVLSNMKSLLTDCPHREKLGWLEQSHLIGPAIMFNYDVRNLYVKIQQDMREAQRESGLVPDIAPEYIVFGYHKGFVDSPEWGSACIINPWFVYKKYGDASILARNYDVMAAYINYLASKTHHSILHHGLGDWLDIGPNTPHSQNTPVPVIATCIYYYDLGILCEVAKMLNKTDDGERYRDLMREVKREFNLQFFDDQTFRYATGSQAAQAMALAVGLVEEPYVQKVLDYLVKDIRGKKNGTTAGDIGHPFVLAALTRFGRSDVINDMMNVTDEPGYGYQVKCGATTLAEEWDGPDPKRPHGSQNHLMLGSGEEWFYTGLAGLQGVRADTPFDQIVIAPFIAEDIQWVKAWHSHPYGRVSVQWKKEQGGLHVQLTIPANATALFILPAANEKKQAEKPAAFKNRPGVQKVQIADGKWQLTLGSGAYDFIVD